ncbi:hypothetical protein [Leptothoe sp. PORK10 BA2]|uniref:hypothetical protein n=1 Tax=Leptothoe sp. PORK10 BA2 TaxID=3110254 RepID=UPI002B1F99AA|nr:hypothetical protein [Leptothoe sp. PORK10 BA2]MEA5466882.1 hypothetical protein [Leptothoe sp. PORK10 BA2]
MSSLEQVQRDIQDLPAEAQALLIDFVEILKKRYPKPAQTAQASPYEKFKASGFIGCVAVEDNLSTTYKQALVDGWGQKYDHR